MMKTYYWSGVVNSQYNVKATATNSDAVLKRYTSLQEPVSTMSMGQNGILHKCESDTAFTVYIMDGERVIAFIQSHETEKL